MDPPSSEKESWAEYQSSEYGIKLKYPADQFSYVENQMNTIVMFASKKDPLHTSLNVIAEDLPEGLTLEGFSQPIEEMAKGGGISPMQRDVRVWDGTLFNRPAKRLSFETSVPAPGGTVEVKVLQTWTVVGNQAFIVTFTAPRAQHKEYRSIIEKMLVSLDTCAAQRMIKSLFFAHYESKDHMFRIRYPWGGWKTEEGTDSSGPVVSFSYDGALSPVETNKVHISTNVTVQDIPSDDMDLEIYNMLHNMRVNETVTAGTTVEKKKTTLGGQEAYVASYRSDVNMKGGKIIQYYTLRGGKIYTITCTHTAKDGDDRPIPLLQRQIASFEFLSDGFEPKTRRMVYENLLYGVGFEFSSKWRVQENYLNTLVCFERIDPSDETVQTCNVNLVVSEIDDEMCSASMDDFVALLRDQLHAAVQDVDIIEERPVDIGGKEGRLMCYTGKAGMPPQELKTQQRFVVIGKKAYIISLSVLRKLYDAEHPHAIPLIETFRFF